MALVNKVISLPFRIDRRQRFISDNQVIQPNYVMSVDGRKISNEELNKQGLFFSKDWRDPMLNRRMTKGEVGCMLSHLKLWEECAKGEDIYLIFEDDFVIDKEQYNEQRIIDAATKYGVAYLSYLEMEKGVIESPEEGLNYVSYPYWCCAYALTPETAQQLVEDTKAHPLIPSDELMPLVRKQRNLQWVAFETQMGSPRDRAEAKSNTEPTSDDDYFVYGKPHFFTVATNREQAYRLVETCKLQDIDIILAGEGQDWRGGDMTSPGGAHKITLLRKAIDTLPDNDIIIFSDGYDSFLVNSSEVQQQIIARYLGFGSDIVFSGEKTCWPDRSLAVQYDTEGDYPFLNSGGFVGSVGGVKHLIDSIGDYAESDDDQLLYTKEYLSKNHDIKIDVEGYIFQTSCDFVQVEGGAIRNNMCYPLVFHGNGGDAEKAKMHKHFSRIYPGIKEPTELRGYLVVAPEILVSTFLTERQCQEIIALAEHNGQWGSLSYDKFPAKEIRLNEVSQEYYELVADIFMTHITQICEEYWSPMEMIGIRDIFVMKYSREGQTSLNLHTDASLVTGSVKLNEDYRGAELVFPRQDFSNINTKTGDVILFPGEVTHGHQCNELLEGVKYSLTIWTKRFTGDTT
jgi:GR25 family glycosyltransferase involved in LPS biosynthesis